MAGRHGSRFTLTCQLPTCKTCLDGGPNPTVGGNLVKWQRNNANIYSFIFLGTKGGALQQLCGVTSVIIRNMDSEADKRHVRRSWTSANACATICQECNSLYPNNVV